MEGVLKIFTENRTLCSAVGLLVLVTSLLYSYAHLILIVWCFLGGAVSIYFIFNSYTESMLFPNFAIFHKRKKVKDKDEDSVLKTACPVCNTENCNRHRPEINIRATQPWIDLMIPQKIDGALQKFLDHLLKEYVHTWYRGISEDKAFIEEISTSLRFIVAVFIRRAKKLDCPNIIIQRLIKEGVKHVHICLQAKKGGWSGDSLQETVLQYYSPHIHCAMKNRKNELEYLRQVTEQLFPHILTSRALQSKSLCSLLKEIISGSVLLPAMDKLADPDMVNNILLIALDPSPPPDNPDPPSSHVCILHDFISSTSPNSLLHPDLSEILSTQDKMYSFMQYMKTEGAVNLLQFYLELEAFSKELLNPDVLTDENRQVDLHDGLSSLYSRYFETTAFDKIHFSDEIISELKYFIEQPHNMIGNLQRSNALFAAHEHVYNLLERTFLPLFIQSDDYYKLYCGERLYTRVKAKSFQQKDFRKFSTRLGKLKGVFKGDGKLGVDEPDGGMPCDDNISVGSASSLYDDEVPDGLIMDSYSSLNHKGGNLKNLSTWRISMPNVAVRIDKSSKQHPVFVIKIDRVDAVKENAGEKCSWMVFRKYNEFYSLDHKLKEFHGEMIEYPLPSKKTFVLGKMTKSFCEEKRPQFEEYLKYLLTKPLLKNSELIHKFLTLDEFKDKSDFAVGKMIKNMPMKLTREKGQHLDNFLSVFHESTEQLPPRPDLDSLEGGGIVVFSPEKMDHPLFENNAAVYIVPTACESNGSVKNMDNIQTVCGVFDSLLYAAENLYSAPEPAHSVLVSSQMLLRETVDTLVEWFIDHKIKLVTEEHRIEAIVELLLEAIFLDTDPARTQDDRDARRDETWKQLMDYLPGFAVNTIGAERFVEGTECIFEILQQPKLNKQLSYTFLDIILEELFPEITKEDNGS